METLVLPAQDQLSQHQYWQKQRVFASPFSRPRNRNPDPLLSPPPSSAPSSPLYRSASEFASPLPLDRSYSGIPENAPKGRATQENGPRTARGNRNFKAANPRSKMAAPRLMDSKPRSGLAKKFELRKKDDVGSSPPKITILQRPQSKEAAMVDLAKITGLPLSEVYAKHGLTLPEEKPKVEPKTSSVRFKEDPRKGQPRKINNSSNNNGKELPKRLTTHEAEQTKKEVVKKVVKLHEESSNVEQVKKLAKLHEEKISIAEHLRKVAKPHEESSNAEQPKKAASRVAAHVVARSISKVKVSNNNTTSSVDIVAGGAPKQQEEQQLMMFSKSFEGFLFEKWAGPAFTNSPPPSSLPIPNFSSLKKQQQQVSPVAEILDNEAATKGLRRILNLDF